MESRIGSASPGIITRITISSILQENRKYRKCIVYCTDNCNKGFQMFPNGPWEGKLPLVEPLT